MQKVEEVDKRIHFALNCGAKSCPPIKLFTPDTLEEGLQSAAAAFCQGLTPTLLHQNPALMQCIHSLQAAMPPFFKELMVAWTNRQGCSAQCVQA